MDAAPANRRSVELRGTRRGRNRPSSSDQRGQCRAVILEFYTTALQHRERRAADPHHRVPLGEDYATALVAVEHAILTAIWSTAHTGALYDDPGADYYAVAIPNA